MVGLLVLIAALALFLWNMVLERSLVASESGAARSARKRRHEVRSTTAASTPARAAAGTRVQPGTSILVNQLVALVRKELICFWRDPQLKIRIFQTFIYVGIFIVFPLFTSQSADESFYGRYTPFVSAALVFLFMLTLSLNTLGIERQSLTTLFLFPIERHRLLWGKNLAVLLLGLVELIILMAVCILLAREPDMVLPAVIIALSGMGVALGWGNFASVYFPRYQAPVGQRGYRVTGGQAQSGGCLTALMSLVMLVVTVITLAPVALGVGIPFFLNLQILWLATIPLSLIYGLVLYIVLTNIAARQLLNREPEILAITTRE